MKKRISRFLAGMLSVALVLSSGSYSVFAVAEDTAGNLEAVESETVSEPDIEPEDTDSSQLPKANEEDAAEAEMPETNAEEQEDQPAVSVSEIEEEGGGENEISANETEPAATAAPVKGVVEVWITAGAPAQSDQEFQAVLTHQVSGDRREEKMILPRTADEQTEASRVLARFPELESGVWELSVTGGGYMAYTQEITVSEGLGCRAQLYTGKVELGDENVHPGLLVRGDVNGDGTLDQADANAIIDVIEATSGVENSGDGRPCDLNGDKIVDLLDLNYLTEYMAGARQKSTIETFVPKEAVSSVSINGQSVSADQIQELFAREQVVSLQPANADAAISAENPVTLEFDMHDSAAMMGGIVLGSPGENYIDEGEIIVQQADGSTETIVIRGGQPVSGEANAGAGEGEAPKTSMMTISLKGMVAVKKVTFRITKTSNAKNLAEISTVEFLNDMEKRIPEPDMNIPQGLTAVPGNKRFSLSWKRENNVTAYEIRIENTPEGADQPLVDYQRTTQTALDVSQFNKDKMHNNVEYRVSVQSLNGEWKSGFSQAVTVVPRPTKKPPKPDRVTAKGGYRSLTVGWTNMEDEADEFFVYYRKDGEETFTEVEIKDGSAVSYTIENLPDDTKYYVYVVAYNDKGRSEDSLIATDKTLAELAPVEMP
nr:fibronectin type III domain-containing protein [uncultured Acetatifactor sp.]